MPANINESKILVPVRLEALMVDEHTSERENWKNFAYDYENMWQRLGIKLDEADPKQLQANLCEPGVHLHWALPAALTNGIFIEQKDKQKGQMVFPAVPNRWLVTRTGILNGKPATKKWIIESDYIDDDAQSPWAIQNTDGSFVPTRIGRATELNSWNAEAARAVTPLTAVAPGNAAFAAIYQSCRNVFGFYDDLSGIEAGAFSYLITGWYSDKAIDPFINGIDAIKKNLRDAWLIPKDSNPSGIFCHGYIHSVRWDSNKDYALPLKETPVNVGVGYTSIEAKATQISKQTGAAEKLLSAFFYDALKDVEGTTGIEIQVDDRAFSQVDGGTLWEIHRTDDTTQRKDGQDIEKDDFPEVQGNEQLQVDFKKLNAEQRNYDRLMQEKGSLHLAFRATSDKIIKAENEEAADAVKQSLQSALSGAKGDIDKIIKDITASAGKIETYKAGINSNANFIKQTGAEKPDFELVERKMSRFWRPNDPVALFSGPGVIPSSKYKIPGNRDKNESEDKARLKCRLVPEIVSQLLLKNLSKPEGSVVSPGMQDLKPLGSLNAENIDIIINLYNEALLLDPQWAAEWAFKYYEEAGRSSPTAIDFGVRLKAIFDVDITGGGENYIGLKCTDTIIRDELKDKKGLSLFLEQRAIQKWKHPWTPVYMIWYLKWMPGYKVVNGRQQYRDDVWLWEDKRYVYRGTVPDDTPIDEYHGKAILTDSVTGLIRARIPDVTTEHCISQAFGSFSNALLMRKQAVQLPVFMEVDQNAPILMRDARYDGYVTNNEYFFHDPDMRVGDVNNFFPVRAGHIDITRLWVTDAFGQVQKIIEYDDQKKQPVVNGAMYVAGNMDTRVDKKIVLTPRIVQPSRLLFRWMNANPATVKETFEESTADPDTSPVCGWIMPDRLNNSLNIYDPSGQACGSVKKSGDEKLEWVGPPGIAAGSTPEVALKDHKFLLGFVNGLLDHVKADKKNAGVLKKLIGLCKDMAMFLDTSSARQAPGVAALIGQPVALVRASLKFELRGLPAQPQGWNDSLTPATKADPPGMQGLQFPVSLGDTRNSRDGLIGYFTMKEGFGKMKLAYGTPAQGNPYFVKEDTRLDFKTSTPPVDVILLMDPRGGVQADCGLLPSKFIDLPHRYTDKPLQNMELHLLVAPFLGAEKDPYLPVSMEQDRSWQLRRKIAGAWKDVNADNQTPLQSNAFNTQKIQEGYLVLKPVPPQET